MFESIMNHKLTDIMRTMRIKIWLKKMLSVFKWEKWKSENKLREYLKIDEYNKKVFIIKTNFKLYLIAN